jgi:hypothetical protein
MRRVVEWLAGMLAPDERDAVLGDLAENGAGSVEACRELVELVLRRQAELWAHWRPWLLLSGLVTPCAILLSYLAARQAHRTAIDLWLYANNWDVALLRYAAYRHGLLTMIGETLASWLGLAVWSWTAGRILRVMPQETRSASIVAFGLMLFLVIFSGGPRPAPGIAGGANNAVFTLLFYRTVYPLMVKAAFVMLPYWRGAA